MEPLFKKSNQIEVVTTRTRRNGDNDENSHEISKQILINAWSKPIKNLSQRSDGETQPNEIFF